MRLIIQIRKEKKKKKRCSSEYICLNFSDWINDCNLIYVEIEGTKFTWGGSLGGRAFSWA